jgi:hypothetical protein
MRYLYGVFFAFCLGSLAAQPVWAFSEQEETLIPGEVAGFLYYSHIAEADFKDPESGDGDEKVSLSETAVFAPVPVYESDDLAVFAGPWAEWFRFEFSGVGDLDNDLDLYTVALPFGAEYRGVQDWSFSGMLVPGFFTDFREVNSEDFKVQVHGLAQWQYTPKLAFALGLAYDTAFGDDDLYPVGGLIWDPAPQWSVRLLLPEPMVVWMPDEKVMLYWHTLPAGGKWNMHDSTQDDKAYDFREESWRSGIGGELRLTESLWFHLSGGLDFDRKYKIENDDGYLLDSEADDSWYIRAGLAIR